MLTIGFNTAGTTLNAGYGIAGFGMVQAMQRLGMRVLFQDTAAPVALNFCQPEYSHLDSNQYKISYVPWESSGLPDGWLEYFNASDEVWTTSDLIKRWYEEAGVKQDIKVYHHGIDHEMWAPRRRKPQNVLKFLHNGSNAPRKGGQQAMDAFVAAFGNRTDVQLTIKGIGHSIVRAKFGGEIMDPQQLHKNVKIVTKDIPLHELPSLYQMHHVFVCNSAGEGFGLPGLEGIASGMPTILNPEWAPYRHHAIEELKLSTKLGDNPWQNIHPGKMYLPDFDSLVEAYRYAYDNYDELSRQAYRKSLAAHAEFDWDKLTAEAWTPIINQFS